MTHHYRTRHGDWLGQPVTTDHGLLLVRVTYPIGSGLHAGQLVHVRADQEVRRGA